MAMKKAKKPMKGMKMGKMSVKPNKTKAPGSPNIVGKKVPNTFGSTQANSVPGLQDSEDMIVP